MKSAKYIADIEPDSGIIEFARTAFLDESGKSLIKKYKGKDKLFTEDGYREYANDLLLRMVNPYLRIPSNE